MACGILQLTRPFKKNTLRGGGGGVDISLHAVRGLCCWKSTRGSFYDHFHKCSIKSFSVVVSCSRFTLQGACVFILIKSCTLLYYKSRIILPRSGVLQETIYNFLTFLYCKSVLISVTNARAYLYFFKCDISEEDLGFLTVLYCRKNLLFSNHAVRISISIF